ncbi:MAG: hypothetical protein AAF682_28710 [Planctomycetota bacterium]
MSWSPRLALGAPLLSLLVALPGGAARPADDAVITGLADRAIGSAEAELERSIQLWEDHSSWSDPWRVRTAHYEVVTNHSYAFGMEIARHLEERFAQFQSLLDTSFEPPSRFQILIFPTLTEYNVFGDQYGAEHSSFIGGFYAPDHPDSVVASYFTSNRPLRAMWVTHGAFRQFRAAAFPDANPPDWVEEGLACYFASSADYAYLRSEVLRLRASEFPNDWIPLRDLLSTPVESYRDRFHNRLVELSMLFTYLRIYREDSRTVVDNGVLLSAPFEDYLTMLVRGQDASSHPLHALFNEDVAALEADFRAFAF